MGVPPSSATTAMEPATAKPAAAHAIAPESATMIPTMLPTFAPVAVGAVAIVIIGVVIVVLLVVPATPPAPAPTTPESPGFGSRQAHIRGSNSGFSQTRTDARCLSTRVSYAAIEEEQGRGEREKPGKACG